MKNQPHAKLLTSRKRHGAPLFSVESRILFLRHRRVILDSDLAELYAVSVKRLNQQVKRNQERFPADFMFRLSPKEYDVLRLQIATSNDSHGGRRYLPFAFTEHGAIMAATVLNSKRAVQMSVFVVRAFVRLRELLSTNRRLASRIYQLENRADAHDDVTMDLIAALRELTAASRTRPRSVGFQPPAKLKP